MINQGISQDDFRSPVFDLFCEYRLTLTNSLWEFSEALFREEKENLSWFRDCLNKFSSPPKIVPFLEPQVVEDVASQVLLDHGYSSGLVDLEGICDEEKEKSGLDVVFYEKLETAKNALLGSIDFDAMKIKIYRQEKEYKPRERFTLAHELGHYFMKHDGYMRGEYLDEEDDDSTDSWKLDFSDIARLEWQANQFASCLLMPRKTVTELFYEYADILKIRNRGHAPLFVDDQPCNLRSYQEITSLLMGRLLVSRNALTIRLKEMNLIRDERKRMKKAGFSLRHFVRYS